MKIIINKEEERYLTITKEFEIESTCGIFADVFIHLSDEFGELELQYLSINVGEVPIEFDMNEVVGSYDEFINCVKEYLNTHNIELPDASKHIECVEQNYYGNYQFDFCIERHSNGDYHVYTMM